MSKSKQDPRVEANAEDIEMFLVFVSSNEHEFMEGMLEENPTLIYARSETGRTALIKAVYSAKSDPEASFETARILMRHGAEPFTDDNDGWSAITMLQLIDEPSVLDQMAKIMGIDLGVPVGPAVAYIEPQKAAATTEPSDLYKAFGTDDALEAMRMYTNDPTVKKNIATLDKMLDEVPSSKVPAKKGIFSKMKLWNVQEIKYDNDLTDIFKNLPALNMDQQKEINKMTMDLDSLLKPTSLALFEVASDNLPLTLIPNEFLSHSYEQISHILGKMQDYFYGSDSGVSDPSHEA